MLILAGAESDRELFIDLKQGSTFSSCLHGDGCCSMRVITKLARQLLNDLLELGDALGVRIVGAPHGLEIIPAEIVPAGRGMRGASARGGLFARGFVGRGEETVVACGGGCGHVFHEWRGGVGGDEDGVGGVGCERRSQNGASERIGRGVFGKMAVRQGLTIMQRWLSLRKHSQANGTVRRAGGR